MSRSRGLFKEIVKNFVNSLRPSRFNKKLIGSDYLGNSYFEVVPPESSSRTRVSRFYEPKGGDTSKFDEPLPPEWEAWLRLRRKDPPTEEEIQKNLQIMAMKKTNAIALDSQFNTKPVEEEQIVTGVKNFPTYEEYENIPGKKP